MLTREQVARELEILRHGGTKAATLFVERSRDLFEIGGIAALRDWVTIAAPALPEAERADVLVTLLVFTFSSPSHIPPEKFN
jgi:hypothetical protein